MSGYSDRPPPGGRRLPSQPGRHLHEPGPAHDEQTSPGYHDLAGEAYSEPLTGPPSVPLEAAPRARPQLRAEPREGLRAPARNRSDVERTHGIASIVPAGSVTGRSLTLVVSIMCFLACLTAGAVYLMNQSAVAWMRDIASEVTVQVEPIEKVDIERTIRDVTTFLQSQPGIASVTAMSAEASNALIAPWLNQVDALKSLPVPRLIALEIDRSTSPNLDKLRQALNQRFKGVVLDDHRQWQQQIRTVTRSFALGGIAILLLVAAATTAIIVSATRAALASNREIVEVLHFVGATDRFIAREFETHFLRLGIKAGLVGAVLAMAVFILMPTIMDLLGGGTITVAELRRLVGSGALDWPGCVLLGLVVVVIAALCMITSRLGVFRILHARH